MPKKPPKPKVNPLVAELLSAASPERFGCSVCKLHETCKTPFLRPYVPEGWTHKLLLIGEAPGKDEDENSGRPFTGKAGELLRKLWRAAGYRDTDVALVNANRCRPPNNRTPSMREVRACRGFLLQAITELRPQYIVALGSSAARALTNDGDATATGLRGRLVQVPGLRANVEAGDSASDTARVPSCYVAVTYHPAATFYAGKNNKRVNAQTIVDDLRRLADPETQPPGFALPGSAVVLAVDAEWDKDGNPLTAAVATTESAYAVEGYPDFWQLGPVLREAKWLAGHSLAQDLEKLAQVGYTLPEEWFRGERCLDSTLLSRLTDENLLSYKLEDLLASTAKVPSWKLETQEILESGGAEALDRDARIRRCAYDAWAAAKLVAYYAPMLKTHVPLVAFTHRIAATLSRLTLAGAIVDRPYFDKLGAELESTMRETQDRLTKAAYAEGLTDFSPTNDNHLRSLLFEKLGLPVLERTGKTKEPSVTKTVLKNLDHPVAKLLLEYNRAQKLWSTNVEGIRELLNPAGVCAGVPVDILSFRFNPLGARTGRRSSSNPNSQNWTKSVRSMVRSRFTSGRIAAFDYSKLEPRCLWFLTREPYLLERFGPGGDGYIGIARDMWGTVVQDGTPQYTATKSTVLGVHYNMQIDLLAQTLWNQGVQFSADWDEHWEQAARIWDKYRALVPRVVEYFDRQERRLLRDGFVACPTGAVRHLPLPDGRNDKGFGHALNAAINYPCQALAAAITGSALVDVEEALLRERGIGYGDWTRLLLRWRSDLRAGRSCDDAAQDLGVSVAFNEVHDELTFDMHPATHDRDKEIILAGMVAVPTLRKLVPNFDIPLGVDPKIKERWHGDV